jgi:hypothetical protein
MRVVRMKSAAPHQDLDAEIGVDADTGDAEG